MTQEQAIAVDDLGDKFPEEAFKTIKSFNEGNIITGTVVKITPDKVLLDIGYKSEGVVPAAELSIKKNINPEEIVSVGDKLTVMIINPEDDNGNMILSKKRPEVDKAWDVLIDAPEGQPHDLKGEVIEVVRGGLIVDIGLRAFLPASLIDIRRPLDLSQYIGLTVEVRVLEFDKEKNNAIVSRKAILEETADARRKEALKDLKVGQIRKGIVSSLVQFGAFVDLDGVDGLVHLSELSWRHVEKASDVVKIGDEVMVEVLDIDQNNRISLSIRSTQKDPWSDFAEHHTIGQIIEGEIAKYSEYGVFVKISELLEGLINASSDSDVKLIKEYFDEGKKIFIYIEDIDIDRRRISLSFKKAADLLKREEQDFDAILYGMPADYDENGNYQYPEGFDVETGQWKDGYENAKKIWEANYTKSYDLWQRHIKFVDTLPDAFYAASSTHIASSGQSQDIKPLENDKKLASLKEDLEKEEETK